MLSCMAGIDLATAQAQLDKWITAQAGVSPVRSIEVDGESISYHDTDRIERMIEYWNRWVLRLSRGSGISAQQMIVND